MVAERREIIHELLNTKTVVESMIEKDRNEMTSTERLGFAMSVMQYNQSFVNVTDGKANSLLLINSIFLATGAAGALTKVLPLAAVVVASIAILLCLAVVFARLPGQATNDRAKLVFFGDIAKRRNMAAYLDDCRNTGPKEISASLLGQVYELASVVSRKFAAYRRAQLVTMFSAALWIANLLVPALAALNGKVS